MSPPQRSSFCQLMAVRRPVEGGAYGPQGPTCPPSNRGPCLSAPRSPLRPIDGQLAFPPVRPHAETYSLPSGPISVPGSVAGAWPGSSAEGSACAMTKVATLGAPLPFFSCGPGCIAWCRPNVMRRNSGRHRPWAPRRATNCSPATMSSHIDQVSSDCGSGDVPIRTCPGPSPLDPGAAQAPPGWEGRADLEPERHRRAQAERGLGP